jgi:hypothetical protein
MQAITRQKEEDMTTKRYEAYEGYGSYNQAHVFDNVRKWIVEFSPSFEAAQAKANELNSEEEATERRTKMDKSVLVHGSGQKAERGYKGIRI